MAKYDAFKGKMFLILFALLLLCLFGFKLVMAKLQAVCGTSQIPDTIFHYSPRRLFLLFNEYGAIGRKWYLAAMGIDLIYPIVYSLLLWFVISFLGSKLPSHWSVLYRLRFFPFVAAFFDYIENGFQIYMVTRFPSDFWSLAAISSWITSIKWMAIYTAFLIIILETIVLVYLKLKMRKA